jgi:hypothetical protein
MARNGQTSLQDDLAKQVPFFYQILPDPTINNTAASTSHLRVMH